MATNLEESTVPNGPAPVIDPSDLAQATGTPLDQLKRILTKLATYVPGSVLKLVYAHKVKPVDADAE